MLHWTLNRRTGKMGLIRDNALSRGATMGATKGVVGAAGLSNVGALGAKINRPLDTAAEAQKVAFDRRGRGEKVLMISGFPQTRRSWNRVIPLLSSRFEIIPAEPAKLWRLRVTRSIC
jgi:hypothetical protein